jgi:hypothetical protein
LPYLGAFELHDWGGYPKSEPDGEYRWAIWKPNRLVALEAPLEGQFTTIERICQGERLLLNFETDRGGWVKVSLAQRPATPPAPAVELEGYSMSDCDVLEGDEISKAVTWKGRSDLSALKGRAVSVRIHMAKAKLFWLAL